MKKRRWLSVTNILIAIIVLCYILDRYFIPIPADYSGFTWAMEAEEVPEIVFKILGLCGGRLTNLLALLGPEINSNGHAFYRYITVVFTHGFLIHLVVNMIALYIIGNFVEKKLGSILTIVLFFFIGTMEAFITDPLYLLYNPSFDIKNVVSVGASGAIFGLMGVGIIICIFGKNKFQSMKLSHKVILAIYGIVFTYLANGSFISWTTFAHNIGLIIGIITMLIIYFTSNKLKDKIQNN